MIRRISNSMLAVVVLVSAFSIAGHAQALPVLTRHTRDVVMNGQVAAIGRVPGNQSMDLTFQLPLRNESQLRTFLQELHNPASPNYRHFLTVDEFTRMYGPSENDY